MRIEGTDGLDRVAAMLARRRDELAGRSIEAIRGEIAAYAVIDDPAILADVELHVAEYHDALCGSLLREREVTADELGFIRRHAANRAQDGVPVADFLQALRVGHRIIWEAILELAEEDEHSPALALAAAGLIMAFFDHASTHAAAAYVEEQQLELAEGGRVRRDLLEDLVAGRHPASGPRLAAARAAGLEPGTRCLLIAAVPLAALDDSQALSSAAATLARATGGVLRPLTVVREDEVVIVRALGDDDPRGVTAAVRKARDELAAAGLPLAIGISTDVDAATGVQHAYQEACVAVASLPPDGGVCSLPELSAFDYLTLRADETAFRLVPPALRQFLSDDAATGGQLTATLLEYAAANLNVKVAAQRLHIHVNTAHQRLARIAERTGCDLRSLADVQELLIAIRLTARP